MPERTVLPPRGTGELSRLLSVLDEATVDERPELETGDGLRVELPEEPADVLAYQQRS